MLDIAISEYILTAMIFLRITALVFGLPVFGDAATPVRVRILLGVALTIGMAPVISSTWAQGLDFSSPLLIAAIVLKEILVGVTIGYVTRLMFAALTMTAGVVGFQMGFGTASLILPHAEGEMNSFTAFHYMIMILLFFGLNLHHILFQAIAETFTLIPAGAALPRPNLGVSLIAWSGAIFSISLQLAAPILVGLLFTMAALGLIARAVPQFNVFTASFPLSFFIGLLIYTATFSFYPQTLVARFEDVAKNIRITTLAFTRPQG